MSNRVAEFPSSPAAGQTATKRPLVRSQDFAGMIEPAKNLILKYPGAALASAFLVGVVVAWWIKRR